MTEINSIPGVIASQETIIEWAKKNKSAAGYFAVLYQKMTHAVQAGINRGDFDDAARMEKLIICFANFYLQAWDGFVNQQPCGDAWRSVFSAYENPRLVVLQHLILGINTHINLDLAKAAVATCPGEAIYDLQNDFEKINNVIASLLQEVQTCLEKIWWPLRFITDITNNKHEAVLNFSINNARKTSWANALALSVVQGELKDNHVALMERMVVGVGEKIIHPGGFTSLLLKPVRWMEDKDVSRLIDILKERTAPAL